MIYHDNVVVTGVGVVMVTGTSREQASDSGGIVGAGTGANTGSVELHIYKK
jgi:hypothetical protein